MKTTSLLTTLGAGLLLSVQAMAIPVVVTGFAYPSNPTTVKIKNVIPAVTAQAYAGGFLTDAGGNSFTSWCVDIFQHTYFGSTVNDYTTVGGATALGASRTDALGRLATQYLSAVTNAATSGAFQIAVWEIINETVGNPYSLTSGNFLASNDSNGAIAIAQSWLNNLGSLNDYVVTVWQSPTRQDLMSFTRLVTVPEAGSLTLLALGLLAAGVVLRRRMLVAPTR